MKLTPAESTLINLISNMPGQSYCPGADSRATPEVNRIIRRLERKGILRVEDTDDGYRYSLAGGVNG